MFVWYKINGFHSIRPFPAHQKPTFEDDIIRPAGSWWAVGHFKLAHSYPSQPALPFFIDFIYDALNFWFAYCGIFGFWMLLTLRWFCWACFEEGWHVGWPVVLVSMCSSFRQNLTADDDPIMTCLIMFASFRTFSDRTHLNSQNSSHSPRLGWLENLQGTMQRWNLQVWG